MWHDKRELFQEMCKRSNEIGAPQYWKTDLTKHDRDYVVNMEPGRYYWIIRECGTHMTDSAEMCRTILRNMTTRALFEIRGGFMGEDSWEISEIPTGLLFK